MVKMEFSLPETKVKKLRFLLARFLQKRKVLLKEMQSLLGLLPFTCWIMPIGRIFSCQLSLAISGLKSPYAHIRLSCSLKENLRVRACFLESYNGRLLFQQEFVSAPDFRLFTDAAGSKGFGAIWKTHWCCAALRCLAGLLDTPGCDQKCSTFGAVPYFGCSGAVGRVFC